MSPNLNYTATTVASPALPIEIHELDSYALQDPEQSLTALELFGKEYAYCAVNPKQFELIAVHGTYVDGGKGDTVFCTIIDERNKISQPDRADMDLRGYLRQNSDCDYVYIVIFDRSQLQHIARGEFRFKSLNDKSAALVSACKIPTN